MLYIHTYTQFEDFVEIVKNELSCFNGPPCVYAARGAMRRCCNTDHLQHHAGHFLTSVHVCCYWRTTFQGLSLSRSISVIIIIIIIKEHL